MSQRSWPLLTQYTVLMQRGGIGAKYPTVQSDINKQNSGVGKKLKTLYKTPQEFKFEAIGCLCTQSLVDKS